LLSPFTGWTTCPNPNDCHYIVNDNYTGLYVFSRRILVSPDCKLLELKKPCYSVVFDSKNIIETHDVIEAKRLAEWYYKNRLKSILTC